MLGVREKSGAELIERLTGRKAVVVLDPTLLLNKEEWAQAIPVKPVLENDYIFCYFLGANSEHRKVAEVRIPWFFLHLPSYGSTANEGKLPAYF